MARKKTAQQLAQELQSARQLWTLYVRRAMRPASASTIANLEKRIGRIEDQLKQAKGTA